MPWKLEPQLGRFERDSGKSRAQARTTTFIITGQRKFMWHVMDPMREWLE